MKTPLAALACFLLLPLSSPPAAAADHETGEFVRTAAKGATYTLIVPDSYDRRKGATMILWLHGAGDNHVNAARWVKSFRMKEDWIWVVPDARANGAWQMEEQDRVMDVVDEVRKAYHVRRSFIGGFSRGGFFTFGFGLNHTDRFAGYLCAGGGIPNPALAKKEDAEKVAIAIIHGEADGTVPFDSATRAREAFESAGWKEKLFFRSTPGLGHTVDRESLGAALDWLDETAQVLKTPRDYYEYGMKLHANGESGKAYGLLGEISEEEAGDEDWWRTVERTREKIEDTAERDGRKLVRAIEADRNDRWLADWRAYDEAFEGVPFHAEVRAAFAECVKRHDAAADARWAEAEAARDADDPKAAIRACLAIRDDCYAAAGESVGKAKALLRTYRGDEEIARRYRRYLKDTEEWK